MKQQSFFKSSMKAYGGELRKKAKNRGFRPLVTKSGSVHVVLKSSKAIQAWSFSHQSHRSRINQFVKKFSQAKGIQILNYANVGNHLHLHIRIPNRILYYAWIRGLASGVAMITAQRDGLKRLSSKGLKFWDHRPFTRIIQSFKHFQNTKRYLDINILEGMGLSRNYAEIIIKGSHHFFPSG